MSEAKYARAIVMLELTVPQHWADSDGKKRLMDEVQRMFRVEDLGVGPGDATLMAMYVRTERGDVLRPHIERLRREYPLSREATFGHSGKDECCEDCERWRKGVGDGQGGQAGCAR